MPKISRKVLDGMNRGELATDIHDAKEDGRLTKAEAKKLSAEGARNVRQAGDPHAVYKETAQALSGLRTTPGLEVDGDAKATLGGADLAALEALGQNLATRSRAAAEALNRAAAGGKGGVAPYPLGALVTDAVSGDGDGSVVTLTLDRAKLPPGEDANTLGRALEDLIKTSPALKAARDKNIHFDIELVGPARAR